MKEEDYQKEVARSPYVFITQRPKPRRGWQPDLSDAERFGSLVYIFDEDDRPHLDPKRGVIKIVKRLGAHRFDWHKDYLLYPTSGDPAGLILIAQLLGSTFAAHTVRWLYWSRGTDELGKYTNENGFYVPLELPARAWKDSGSP